MPKHAWHYDHLTWPEMNAGAGRIPQPVVLALIDAVEDHGPHMSLSTDNDILEGSMGQIKLKYFNWDHSACSSRQSSASWRWCVSSAQSRSAREWIIIKFRSTLEATEQPTAH